MAFSRDRGTRPEDRTRKRKPRELGFALPAMRAGHRGRRLRTLHALARPRLRRRDGLPPPAPRASAAPPQSVLESACGRCVMLGMEYQQEQRQETGTVERLSFAFRSCLLSPALARSPPTPGAGLPPLHLGPAQRPRRHGSKPRCRAARAAASPTPPRSWSATSPAAPGSAGSARTRCSSTRAAAASSSSARS